MPRIINVIADATLLFAYGVDRRNVDVGITQDVLAELDATGVLASYQSEGARAAAATRAPVAETEHAMRVADEIRRREQALAARERELAQREQQVAARQRVVEEEARILAAARAKMPAAPPAVAAPGTMLVGATVHSAGASAAHVGANPTPAAAGTTTASASPIRRREPEPVGAHSTASVAAPANGRCIGAA